MKKLRDNIIIFDIPESIQEEIREWVECSIKIKNHPITFSSPLIQPQLLGFLLS